MSSSTAREDSIDDTDDDRVFCVEKERQKARTKRVATMHKRVRRHSKALREHTDSLESADMAQLLAAKVALDDLIDVRAKLCADTDDTAAAKVFGTDRKFNIILADPPWDYNQSNNRNSAAEHYPTMKFEELAAMPVSALAHDDAVLLMWVTGPHIAAGTDLMRLWGFGECNQVFATWIKVAAFLAKPMYRGGAYTQTNAEYLLVAKRGVMQVMHRTDFKVGSVIRSRPREHSRKPRAIRQMIKRVFGDLPAIELFARESDPSWHAFGNDVERFDGEEACAGGEQHKARQGRSRANNLSSVSSFVRSRGGIDAARRPGAAIRYDRGPRSVQSFYDRPTRSMLIGKDACESVDRPHRRLDDDRREPPPDSYRIGDMLAYASDPSRGVDSFSQRHSIYTELNERQVAAARDAIIAQQEYNSELLFVVNNNTGKRRRTMVRYSALTTGAQDSASVLPDVVKITARQKLQMAAAKRKEARKLAAEKQ